MTTARDDLAGSSEPSGPGGLLLEHLVVVEAVPVRGDGVAAALTTTGRYHVTVHRQPALALGWARESVADPPRLAVVDLSFPGSALDGVDVAEAFARWCPETALVLRGGEPGAACERLAANWRGLQPLSLLSRARAVPDQVDLLHEIVRTGLPYRDPGWRWPTARSQAGSS